jgi:DNA-binding NarL/FixJ family response regulator
MFRICFVDDDEQFEIPLFCDVFGEAFDIITASDYSELKSRIGRRRNYKPDLFVLDLYFPSGPADEEAVEEIRKHPLSVEIDNAEIRKTYSNYLKARERLHSVLEAWRQNADGGILLAERIAADYPDVPIVFYSRKATFEDIIRCMTITNVRFVERKPTGKDSADTIELTIRARQRIIHRFKTAISKTDSANLERKKEAAKTILEMLQNMS